MPQFSGTGYFHRIALSPDGRRAAVARQMRPFVDLWDPHAGRRLGQFFGHPANPHRAAFSPDGTLLATGGGDEGIRLWNVANRQEVRCLRGNPQAVAAVAFAPDGRWLASGGRRWRGAAPAGRAADGRGARTPSSAAG